MEMLYNKGKELDDKKIVKDLRRSVDMYENGEIAEVRDILCEIVLAIDEFEKRMG